ncbi:putative pentatricopeptide repeat-containing protein At3g15930 [Punica granatum]|uniref:Pentatricopeptide repeat-containing protein At3g15930 n=1 Tax=Punica granatum TaxID=22663 RepID=A0A218X565_PUNGR|nr:putative pentatricopeptide repeat-containing protein At3g15930 [Punica granatum]OWM79502.1 hypothetical protein CDL15_Pgr022914 [Punica granatum]
MKKLGSRAGPISRLFSSTASTQQAERVAAAAEELHARLIRTHLHSDPSAISDVVKSYALSPSHLQEARLAFNEVERPTPAIFNHMIRGLSQSDEPASAIDLYRSMRRRGLAPSNSTFIFLFKACGRTGSLVCGEALHVHALKLGVGQHVFVSNALICTYYGCGRVELARKVFDEMPERDLVSWNSLICGYSQSGRFGEVLHLFDMMQARDMKADAVTMVKVILACGYMDETKLADRAVEYVEREKVEVDVYLGNTLIDFYGKRGSVESARGVFNRMRGKNLVSWNAMMKAYTRAGDLASAQALFDQMPRRDVISWTSMITGYAQANCFSDSVKLFQDMMAAKVKPDKVTVASVLSACAHLGSLGIGRAVHDYIRSHNVKTDVYVGNALIDMYCKCASIEKAFEVFREMKDQKDEISWTSIIAGLAVNGYADQALELFLEMSTEGIKPTHGTFVGILLACSHAGLVDKGLEFFRSMEEVHGLRPEMKHYGCVVDLLSRSGNLERAYEFITEMPVSPDIVIWRILLSACKIHGNVAMAEIVTKKLLELDPSNSGNYVLLSNAYASLDRWHDATSVRDWMEESDVHKPSAWSSIESNKPPSHSSMRSPLHF